MHNYPSNMVPLHPSTTADLEDMSREVVARSVALGGRLHPLR